MAVSRSALRKPIAGIHSDPVMLGRVARCIANDAAPFSCQIGYANGRVTGKSLGKWWRVLTKKDRQRIALAVANTAQRASDQQQGGVSTLRRCRQRGRAWPEKTGEAVDIPIHPELARH